MDHSEEIVRLLEEIRDNQLKQMAENARVGQEYAAMRRASVEEAEAQHLQYVEMQREQAAEYARANHEQAELYRQALEKYDDQYRQYLEANRPNIWSLLLLIGSCIAAGFFLFARGPGSK